MERIIAIIVLGSISLDHCYHNTWFHFTKACLLADSSLKLMGNSFNLDLINLQNGSRFAIDLSLKFI